MQIQQTAGQLDLYNQTDPIKKPYMQQQQQTIIPGNSNKQ